MQVWTRRLRLVVATALVWSAFHFVAGRYAVPRGLDRPVTLAGAPAVLPAGLFVMVILWAGAAAATLITGPGDVRRPLMAVSAALALWAYGRGTMNGWLIDSQPVPGSPAGGVYGRLLVDYAFLIPGMLGAYLLATAFGTGRSGRPAGEAIRAACGLTLSAGQRAAGLAALVITTVVSGVAIFFLMGPVTGKVLHGQVYFAVGLGCIAGVWAAGKLVKVHEPLWYWPVPLVLGVVALVVAAMQPELRLPEGYRFIDTIPAWQLARALPIEMVGVGTFAVLWMLGPPAAGESRPAAG